MFQFFFNVQTYSVIDYKEMLQFSTVFSKKFKHFVFLILKGFAKCFLKLDLNLYDNETLYTLKNGWIREIYITKQ